MADTILEVRDLHHTYLGATVEALAGIDLAIEAGEYVAVIGANGSGKSTLARHLDGLLAPGRGSVRVAGIDTRDEGRLAEVRRAVQMVFQQPDAQIVATIVEEDVAFGPENFGVPEAELGPRVREALETVGMWGWRARPPHLLSGGQKQRVAIAGALAVRPRVLVLDEATAMLDPAGRAAVLEVLRLLNSRGTTIVTITHEMDEAAEAGRVIVLDRGRLAMDAAAREVFGRARELRALGLDVPPAADLALRLGLPVCLTAAELLARLGEQPLGQRALAKRPAGAPADEDPAAGGRSCGAPPIEPVAADGGRQPARPEMPPSGQAVPAGRPADPMIRVEGLRHVYLRGTPFASEALRGVDFEVARGEIAGLVGQTGSGKSTLLQHLNGLMRPQAGRVIVDGRDWADPALDVRQARRRVGLLFQQPEDQLFERYVGDDVAFGPRQMRLSHAEVRERVAAAMDAVGLDFATFKDRLTRSLSGGELRRAALAGVLALQAPVLVADEPTSGLDPAGRAEVLAIFRRAAAQGTTVVVASHRMEDVAALCERVIALRAGQVVAAGPVRAVLGRPAEAAAHGLAAPPIVALAAALRSAGWPVPEGVLTVEEVAAAVGVDKEQVDK